MKPKTETETETEIETLRPAHFGELHEVETHATNHNCDR